MAMLMNSSTQGQDVFGILYPFRTKIEIIPHLAPLFLHQNIGDLEFENIRTEQPQFAVFQLGDNFQKGIGFLLDGRQALIIKRTRVNISIAVY